MPNSDREFLRLLPVIGFWPSTLPPTLPSSVVADMLSRFLHGAAACPVSSAILPALTQLASAVRMHMLSSRTQSHTLPLLAAQARRRTSSPPLAPHLPMTSFFSDEGRRRQASSEFGGGRSQLARRGVLLLLGNNK
jgi:hypothetical protein